MCLLEIVGGSNFIVLLTAKGWGIRMKYQTIIIERRQRVGIITLNRPEVRNALNTQLVKEIQDTLGELEDDPEIRIIIIKGAGKSFCSGHDFSGLQGKNVLELRHIFRRTLRVIENIATMSKPVIAAVHGYVSAMGCALAAGCDLVIAADNALFQLPGINLGVACISPAAVVSRSMSRKKCLELLLTGDSIEASEAEKAGLVNRVVPLEKLDDAAAELAEKLASKAPLALEFGKQAFYNMLDMEQSQAYNYAAEMIAINLDTEDGKEGVASFLEKRKPRPWQGR